MIHFEWARSLFKALKWPQAKENDRIAINGTIGIVTQFGQNFHTNCEANLICFEDLHPKLFYIYWMIIREICRE